MSDVKRYELHFAADSMLKVDDAGRFVLASDYDALAQRCAELEADLTEQADLLKETIEQRDSLDRLQSDECFRREKAEAERDTLRAEVERLREIREIASQCAANGGYLSSQDLIELRELLWATK